MERSYQMFSKGIIFAFLLQLLSVDLQGKSLTNLTNYPAYCLATSKDPAEFQNFRRNPIFCSVVELVPYSTGVQFFDYLKNEYPEILLRADQCRTADSVGNPETYFYPPYGLFSPTTLRYMKIAGDLKREFGDLSQKHILEIGAGCGGQCKILSEITGFASYTIVDLPECNELIKKYLEAVGVQNVYFINSNDVNQIGPKQFDLVISNYAFSEIDRDEQRNYIEKLVKNIPMGYMNYSFVTSYFGLQSIPMNEFLGVLYANGRSGQVIPEEPLTHPTNVTLTWNTLSKSSVIPTYPKLRLLPSPAYQQGAVISHSFSGGRLGDNLLSYLHAKWMAYRLRLPFIYKSFPYSDQFKLHELEQISGAHFLFANEIEIKNTAEINSKTNSTLYKIPYFPEYWYEFASVGLIGLLPYYKVNWDDPTFRTEVIKCLAPKNPIQSPVLPQDRLTVAVHVRRGGGVDHPNAYRFLPLKFPPDSYYIQQIKFLADMFKDKSLYVYIFTDDLYPLGIIKTFQEALNNPTIEFDCRKTLNSPHLNVLEDFYAMTQFDCLILCQSNLSLVASKIADYKVAITPIHPQWTDDQLSIDQVEIKFRQKNENK